MKIERSKEWWIEKAGLEGNVTIGAGAPPRARATDADHMEAMAATTDPARLAFGKFVNLMRRQRGLSVEELAKRAEIDDGEVLVIEEDAHHAPEPRTIYKLAQCFDVPQQRLMQLAGLAMQRDPGFERAALKFAARSEGMQKLSPDESAALEAFIEVLSEPDANSKT